MEIESKDKKGNKSSQNCFKVDTQELLKFEGYQFLAAFSGRKESNRHVVTEIASYDLDAKREIKEEDVWGQFKIGLEELFTKDQTIDIFDKYGDHSTNLDEERKQYNKQLEVYLNRFTKIKLQLSSIHEDEFEQINKMPKQQQLNEIHKSCEVARENLFVANSEVAQIVGDLDVQLSLIDPDKVGLEKKKVIKADEVHGDVQSLIDQITAYK